MPAQMNARLGANAMVAAETTPSAPPKISVRRRPSKSAAMPLGTSHSRLTPWKTPSARPICSQRKAAGRQQRDPDGVGEAQGRGKCVQIHAAKLFL